MEDGEIEDDDENNAEIPVPVMKPPPAEEKSQRSPEKKSSENKKSSSSSRKDRGLPDEDDFMSNIESQIASVLKKEGVEPPMPNIKRPDPESDGERAKTSSTTSRGARKRRRRKERRDRDKRENTSSKVSPKTLNIYNCCLINALYFRNARSPMTVIIYTWLEEVPITLIIATPRTPPAVRMTPTTITEQITRRDATVGGINIALDRIEKGTEAIEPTGIVRTDERNGIETMKRKSA